MNKSNLEREYRNLTVNERATLMIAAKMRRDDSERNRLIASAEGKHYLIRGEEESAICETWFDAHMLLILLDMEQKIAELSAALVNATLLVDEELKYEFDKDLAQMMSNMRKEFRERREVGSLAFQDWMAENELQIDSGWLEACNVDLSIGGDNKKTEMRNSSSYRLIATDYQRIKDH